MMAIQRRYGIGIAVVFCVLMNKLDREIGKRMKEFHP